MPIEITMPRLSDTMEQGTIVSWNVKEGDEVNAGDVLGDIETDKATMELQNFEDGVVAAILLGEGESVGVGETIMLLAEEGEDAAEVKKGAGASSGGAKAVGGADAPPAPEAATATAEPPAGAGAPRPDGPNFTHNGYQAEARGRVFASPLARKIAEEKGIDLSTVRGSGPSGRIVRADVESLSAPAPAPAPGATGPAPAPAPAFAPSGTVSRSIPLSNMRATIARRLVESKQSIPHYQVTVAVRMDALLALRKQLNQQLEAQGVKLSVNDFLVRACALAMHEHPHTNASWGADGRSVELHADVNIGVAIALPLAEDGSGGGLVVATLRHADRMGLRQISADTRALAEKARGRGLTIEEMADATFTISNLGMYGVEHFTAVINPPNVAILAVGGAVRKPVVDEATGELVVGHEMQMTMSSDHRVVDGAMAAQYLASVKRSLESPATLLV